MTLIVLEGCDGAGKSSLAEALLRLMPGTIVHKGPPTEDAFTEYIDIPYPTAAPELVILDRWHLGEMIYGPMFRGASQINMEQALRIDFLLDTYGAIKLHLDAPDKLLIERAFGARGEDFIKESDVPLIARQYRNLCTRLRWRTVLTNLQDADTLARQIMGEDED